REPRVSSDAAVWLRPRLQLPGPGGDPEQALPPRSPGAVPRPAQVRVASRGVGPSLPAFRAGQSALPLMARWFRRRPRGRFLVGSPLRRLEWGTAGRHRRRTRRAVGAAITLAAVGISVGAWALFFRSS